jgi:hypothetical protein
MADRLYRLARTVGGGTRFGKARSALEGFGVIAPGVLAHPQADSASVQELLEEAQVRTKWC